MLYKQYTDLCEPGGARFLAFGVDPGFSDAIDGLIEVDLHRIRPNKRRRYLRPAGGVPACVRPPASVVARCSSPVSTLPPAPATRPTWRDRQTVLQGKSE